jgi:predicted transcriptional regulator
MAKTSRSSKKQPAFDPSELEDLIFSPAVGSGVGSHLLGTQPELSTVVELEEATVDILAQTDLATVIESPAVDESDPTTVAVSDTTTVGMPELPTEVLRETHTAVESDPVVLTELPTDPESSTVDISAPDLPRRGIFWITEHGDLVPQGRVKRITLAQDVINPAEESVYDTLWTATPLQSEDSFRIVQAGYDYLGRKTRLSKKTIQRIVAKLIDKDFIAVERPADIYQRTSTVYRVFSYKAVLDRHIRRGRSHVAKMGPGFSYVQPLRDPRLDLSTVLITRPPTVGRPVMATADKAVSATGPEVNMSTVVRPTTPSGENDGFGKESSSVLHEALSRYGAVDDDVVRRLVRNCRTYAPDCTDAEIAHFIEEKGSLVRGRDSRIYSPVGFLLTAVPKCFAGEAFRLYRSECAKQREAEAAAEARRVAELEEWGREQRRLLDDPSVPEEEKQFIRKCLGLA